MKLKKKSKKRFNWRAVQIACFSVHKATEGGIGYYAMESLKDAGIPCRKGYSPFVGQVGIDVPKKFEKKASKILFG